jgi:CheY-like chemotaxis protein
MRSALERGEQCRNAFLLARIGQPPGGASGLQAQFNFACRVARGFKTESLPGSGYVVSDLNEIGKTRNGRLGGEDPSPEILELRDRARQRDPVFVAQHGEGAPQRSQRIAHEVSNCSNPRAVALTASSAIVSRLNIMTEPMILCSRASQAGRIRPAPDRLRPTAAGVIDTAKSARAVPRQAALAEEPVPFQEETMQDRKKIRILIIDDDNTFRELASMLLAEAGYAIETAVDAIEGGKALLTRNFDLVISDINMPYMTGLELASLLRTDETTASVPLILASSRMDPDTISKAIALRAADYMIKPVTLERLLDTVGGVVKRLGLGK